MHFSFTDPLMNDVMLIAIDTAPGPVLIIHQTWSITHKAWDLSAGVLTLNVHHRLPPLTFSILRTLLSELGLEFALTVGTPCGSKLDDPKELQ
jgi:hypothetical protein